MRLTEASESFFISTGAPGNRCGCSEAKFFEWAYHFEDQFARDAEADANRFTFCIRTRVTSDLKDVTFAPMAHLARAWEPTL